MVQVEVALRQLLRKTDSFLRICDRVVPAVLHRSDEVLGRSRILLQELIAPNDGAKRRDHTSILGQELAIFDPRTIEQVRLVRLVTNDRIDDLLRDQPRIESN